MNAYEKALKLLKIRPHHSEELRRKLMMRGFKREEVASAIDKLAEEGLIDNEQFAQVFLDNLVKYKSFGFYGLKAKLMQRGLPGNEAETLLKEKLSLDEELAIARKFLEKSRETDRTKLAQKLSRKGFRSEVIRSSLPGA